MSDSKPSGVKVEGDPDAIDFIRTTTRLYYEMPPSIFPENTELRWFLDGIHVVDLDTGRSFQAPMNRIEDLIVPQVYPNLPTVRMTDAARRAKA